MCSYRPGPPASVPAQMSVSPATSNSVLMRSTPLWPTSLCRSIVPTNGCSHPIAQGPKKHINV
eukprot:5776972-Amphidinium_carterae.1